MFIVLHCGGIAFNGDTIKTRSLGGSETAAYYLARELVKKGHHVRMFTNCAESEEGDFEGVRYISAGRVTEQRPLGERFHLYATMTPHDILIVQRHPLGLVEKYACKQAYLWLHDLALVRNKPGYDSGAWQMTGAFVVSEFHKAQVEKVLNVQPRVLLPITNGVDPERYAQAAVTDGLSLRARARDVALLTGEFALLYSSRPERGLENLVRPGGIMDQLREKAPKAHLYVCNYQHDVPEMAGFYGNLFAMAKQLPNVTVLGHLTQADLAAVQKSVQLHVYPTDFEEVSCITAMECMHAGLPMLVSRHAAIPETCKGAGVLLVEMKDGAVDTDAFVTHVTRLAKRGVEAPEYRELVARQVKKASTYTWEHTAAQVMSHIEAAFSKATSNHPALLRHLLRHSDVQSARHLVATEQLTESKHPIVQRCLEEMKLYDFADDPVKYAQHYAKGCGEFYDGPEFNGAEDCSGHPRFECVADWVGATVAGRTPDGGRRLVLLDVGCAHGHYTVGLAKRFPQVDFIGLDVSRRAVEEARKAAVVGGVSNCRFEVVDGVDWTIALGGELAATGTGGGAEFATASLPKADIVLMGEVLEHVLDSYVWCQRVLLQLASAGTQVIFTVPIGPWEEISYLKNHPTRFHVQHFERQDLTEMFGSQPGFELNVAPNSTLPNGDFIGNYVGRFDWNGFAFGKVDIERKLAEQMPRETLTLGMIVKNGASTLRKTLEQVVDAVEEVVIGVDAGTTDDTEQVIASVIGKRPLWPVLRLKPIQPALESGFDAARNATLEEANGDWFLWLDADEDFVRTPLLMRYLRPNCFNGYAIPQHHFAVEPVGVLMTDLPSRLFRVGCGAQFHGRVHEHPEIGNNQGVGAAMVIPGVHIAHHGYYTEEIRRARFQRNIGLMVRDRKENPKRKLGKFLWIRDLSHMISFTLEQTGGRATPQVVNWAREAILMFQEMLADGDIRLVLDALNYYSNAVKALGGGIEIAFRLDVQRGQEALSVRANEVKGTFADRSHAEKLNDLMLRKQLDQFDTKYW